MKTSNKLIVLSIYVLLFFYAAVLDRGQRHFKPRLDLFWSYRHLDSLSFRGSCLNILCFIPIGIMVGLISDKYKILKALIVGLLVSLTTEFSQLIWIRGVFDVDDLLNNSVGAFIGGVVVVLAMKLRNKR